MKQKKKTERIEIRTSLETKQLLKEKTENTNCKSESEYITRLIHTDSKKQNSSEPSSEYNHESHVESALMLNHILNCIYSHRDSTEKLIKSIRKEVETHVFY